MVERPPGPERSGSAEQSGSPRWRFTAWPYLGTLDVSEGARGGRDGTAWRPGRRQGSRADHGMRALAAPPLSGALPVLLVRTSGRDYRLLRRRKQVRYLCRVR